jgi:CheY-like chemotaxis protein
MNILLIDDDVFLQKALSFELLQEGHQVTIARDGSEALKLIENLGRLDLILCDVMMPSLTGPSFILSLKAQLKKLPAIFVVSGLKDGQDFLKKIDIPYNKYFSKPLDFKVLKQAIAALEPVA